MERRLSEEVSQSPEHISVTALIGAHVSEPIAYGSFPPTMVAN